MEKFGLYIHWPFCLSKCPYCDFFSQVGKGYDEDRIIKEYLDDLTYYHNMTADKIVTSIFFGGGTPSLIKPYNIEKIINHVRDLWKVSADLEITLEANPNTNHANMFSDLKNAGINRISLGVQSIHDEDLSFLGRTHDKKQALQAIDDVVKTFDNHSIDIIYALPHQNLEQWERDLNLISSMGLKHLSLYQLMIEEGTAFYKRGIKSMEDEAAIEMYNFTTEHLKNYGYEKYEVSNFAKDGCRSRHNLTYWEGYDYVGIGKSAHGRIRFSDKIYATTHRKRLEILTPNQRAEELVIMGLRIVDGINKARFKNLTGMSFESVADVAKVKSFEDIGLLQDSKNSLKLTKSGFEVMDYIIAEILADN